MGKLFIISFFLMNVAAFSQSSFPWQHSLIIVQSNDGINFSSPAIFQDSSGVPCIIHWKADILVAVFQWFRQPNPSPTWDRVAVKFSYNNGLTWTNPTPIVINGLPPNFQRPFDPTVVVTPDKRLRIFYSSSNGMPLGGLTSIVDTYSAISSDGINYSFEPGARFDNPNNRVIDPAVTIFNNTWQYLSPIAAPQDGAYHCTSTDGLLFTQTANISSDNNHNWTGNFLVEGPVLKFYGSGQNIWFNSSLDGNTWNGYVNTNIMGGDPGIVKLNNGKYLMIYVGPTNITVPVIDPRFTNSSVIIYPNPARQTIILEGRENKNYPFSILTAAGSLVMQSNFNGKKSIDLGKIAAGTYLFVFEDNNKMFCRKLVKQ
jgi:hypothetical protein